MSAKNPTTRAVNALRSFLPPKPPPSLDTRAGNLYQVLSRHPNDGVGLKVHQTRWGEKGIARSYWKITRSSLKMEGRHGNAWGKLFWKGVPVGAEEPVRGGLKYKWRTGHSTPSPAALREFKLKS